MHRYRVWLLAAVLSLAIAVPASAWEFSMDGAFTWEYDYRSQGGASGFFGPYDQDAGSGIGGTAAGFFAPINGWLGEHAGTNGGFVSGSDASWNVFYMSTNMDIRINPAIRLRGNYYIGEWGPTTSPDGTSNIDFADGNLVASQALNSRWSGIQRSFSPGYWNMLWLTAELPWGIVTLGKRKSTFGIGMGGNNGEESRSSESLALTVPYGPLRLQISIYPAKRASTSNNYNTAAPPVNTAGYYNQDFDKNNGRWWDTTIAQFTYRNGPFEAGAYINPIRFTNGGEGIINSFVTRATTQYTERAENYGVAYMKYNNGRFFFNTELDWDLQTNRNRKKASVAGGPALQTGTNALGQTLAVTDTYMENWRAAAEGGVLCGPAKLALITAWASGPDRRAGRQIDRTGLNSPAGRSANVRRPTSFSNTGLFRPYSLLMVYDYGLGTHINGDTGNGYVEDAMVYGARLDYAVAANLNTYLSFFWADRVSQSGYGWGFIKPVLPAAAGTLPAGTVAIFHDTTDSGAPSIPDTNLGYEFGAGFDWKLLEGLTMNFSSAYWQPGQWFSWACVDKTIVGWASTATPAGSGNNPVAWHVNPNKQIDPIFGIELKVTGDF